jgi:hypothetical protein
MTDEVGIGGVEDVVEGPRLVPMRVGTATVWVEQTGPPLRVDSTDEAYAVSPDIHDVFSQAVDVVRECVKTVGSGIEEIKSGMHAPEVTIEFSVSFHAQGKASIIPIFVTGEAGTEAGLKVTATWPRQEPVTSET